MAIEPFLVHVSDLPAGILLAKKSHQGNFPLMAVCLASLGKGSGELVVDQRI
jgi:hypothetical protein